MSLIAPTTFAVGNAVNAAGGGDTSFSIPGILLTTPGVMVIQGTLSATGNNKRFRLDGAFSTIFDTGSNLNGIISESFSLVAENKGDQFLRMEFRTSAGSYVAALTVLQTNPSLFTLNGSSGGDIEVTEVTFWQTYQQPDKSHIINLNP